MNSRFTAEQALNRQFWQKLNPEFNITERSLDTVTRLTLSQSVVSSAVESLRKYGYFRTDQLLDDALMDRLAKGVQTIWKAGLPTPFAVVYDEYWQVFHSLADLFGGILGRGYKQVPNFWCWYVNADSDSKGWGCHRDRPSVQTVKPNGRIDTLTVWIPLSNATVRNGCIYVLPLPFDPNYPDNLGEGKVLDQRNVRALPATRGSILGWTESILHWGSRSSEEAEEPRISISFTYQRDDAPAYEIPLFDTGKLPPFEERLGLIGQNVIKYKGHDQLPVEVVTPCESLGNLIPPIQVLDGYERQIIDTDKRLSDTQLWRLQEELHEHECLNAIIRTPFCKLYADMVLAFILDYAQQFDLAAPLYILELGGGTGCFAYRFLQELLASLDHFARLRDLKIRYVLTDGSEKIVTKYADVKRLAPYAQKGVLDFAIFRPQEQETVKLVRTGNVLSKHNLRNPLIVIANQFFGSLQKDAFRIRHENIKEARYTLFRDAREFDLNTPIKVEQLRLIERFFDCPPNYYDEPILDSILEYYRGQLAEANVIVPIGALQVIANLLRLSHNQLALFAADKGFTALPSRDMKGLRQRDLTVSDSSFLFDVNFDAIVRYFQALGGRSYMQAGGSSDLFTTANFLLKDREWTAEHFNHFFAENLNKRNLANSLHGMEELVPNTTLEKQPQLPIFLSLLQAYNFEPVMFCLAFDKLVAGIESELAQADDQQKKEMAEALQHVWRNVYLNEPKFDALDRLLKCHVFLRRFDDCLALCQEALDIFGPLGTIIDHFAVCYESQGKFDLAYQYFHKSVEQKPDHQWAREGLERTKLLCYTGAGGQQVS